MIIWFEPRVRQIDIQYELDNNQRFDDGVFVTTQQSLKSKSKSENFSQKSRTKTFTSKKDSSKLNSTSFINDEEETWINFNQFGDKGIQEIKLDNKHKIKLEYNLVYACRRYGYPYVYTLKWMVVKEINYWSAFLRLVRKGNN